MIFIYSCYAHMDDKPKGLGEEFYFKSCKLSIPVLWALPAEVNAVLKRLAICNYIFTNY